MTFPDRPSMPAHRQSKIQSLEGLRGVMAWWVVFGHISLAFNFHVPIIDRNTLPVDVFVLLSGFVIARLLDRKNEPYFDYIVRRGFRIIPLYLVALCLSTVLLGVQAQAWTQLPIHSTSNTNRIALALLALNNLAPHLLAHLSLLHGLVPEVLLPSAAFTLLGQAWSISLEWQFYLVAPAIMWGLAMPGRRVGLAVALLLLLLSGHYFSNGFLGNRIAQFVIGIATYLALDRPEQRKYWMVVVTVCCALAMIENGPWQALPLALWIAVIGSSAAPSHSPAHVLAKVLSSRPLVHLGEISYSIYLVHMLPLYCTIDLLTNLHPPLLPSHIANYATVATIICAYMLALLSFNVIEKPAIRLGARLLGQAKSAVD